MDLKIGNIIKKRREELGLTQAVICNGICTVKTLSRIENNDNFPSPFILEALLERLKISMKSLGYMAFGKDCRALQLKEEIINAQTAWNFEKASKLIGELCECNESDEPIVKQFILFSKVVIDKNMDYKEKILMLEEAIKITIPMFNIDNFEDNILSLDECTIIINIANNYMMMKNWDKAETIYKNLLNICTKYFDKNSVYYGSIILICCNLSQCLNLQKKYYEVIPIADKGIEKIIADDRIKGLGEILSYKAYSLCQIGNIDEGYALYKKAIVVMELSKSDKNRKNTIKIAKEDFHLDLLK